MKTYEADDGRIELRAITGPDYGRIFDHELVAAVMRIAGNGTGDTMWKVPGVLDWTTMTHNPFVDVTKDTTTLYASDRDVFLFLVDDTHPIEAGRLADGSPDCSSGFLRLEQRSRIEDSRDRVFLSPRGLRPTGIFGARRVSRKSASGIQSLPHSVSPMRPRPR